jgi:hypothetical protein
MARIYISSTYSDLKEFREEAYRTLRKMEHDVVAMEDYTAADERPLDKCLADVRTCDVYIGIFAWRYGYIPPEQEKSITELEFREASSNRKKCLLFLLHEDAQWRKSQIDKETGNIDRFREELKKNYLVDFFNTKDDLVSDIAVAVSNALAAEKEEEEEEEEHGDRVRPLIGPHDNHEAVKDILVILKPIMTVFLSILALTVLTMIICISVPSVRNEVDLKMALFGLGGISTFLICCLMFIFNKFVQISKGD